MGGGGMGGVESRVLISGPEMLYNYAHKKCEFV